MHTFSKKILLLVFPSLLLGSMAGCRGDAEKLAEKERELEELRQLAELDNREMENQYAQFALQYDEL